MEAVPVQSIPWFEGCFVCYTNYKVCKPKVIVHSDDKCISDYSKGSVDVETWYRSATPHVFEQATDAHKTTLFNVWMQIWSSNTLLASMTVLIRSLSELSHNHHKSSDTELIYRKANCYPNFEHIGLGWVYFSLLGQPANASWVKQMLPLMSLVEAGHYIGAKHNDDVVFALTLILQPSELKK